MHTLKEIAEAISAGDFSLAEERLNSITDFRELGRVSEDFASSGQYTWSTELRHRADALRQGVFCPPFQFYPERERMS